MADQALAGEFRRLLDGRGVRAVYQPIVDLQTLEPVAYEALSRGPSGSPLESPAELFGWAAQEGLTPELDRLCRSTAVDGAARLDRAEPFTLFVNVEPEGLGRGELFAREQKEQIAGGKVRVVVEMTERALTARPAELLDAVRWLRERSVGIALDDVGVDARSLALMPFLSPDVIKLDMTLVQDAPTRAMARITNAVWAEAERGGSVILAEGIENEDHLRRAISMGARYGQGWLFGRPEPLSDQTPTRPGGMRRTRQLADMTSGTPFEVVSARRELSRGDKMILLERSLQLESEAFALGCEGIVLSTFQESAFFTPITARRYEQLGAELAFVAAFGVGMPDEPVDRVRGGAINESETLRGEWNVIVVGPHFAGAFVARDLGDSGPDMSRRFEFAMTYERELVLRAARVLMERVVRS
jgi:EAL domain-containing protein (putative c-di-GMP-specific phosphodiesterase class I)